MAQEITIDQRPQSQKEDPVGEFNADQISQLDLLEALDLAGIQIHKFQLGNFDKKYNFYLFADEYADGMLVKTDTLLAYHNQYGYSNSDDDIRKHDFIDQIKIFTKTEDNRSTIKISTYVLTSQKSIGLNKLDNRQFFIWRDYFATQWILNQKVPLMIFASSWYDEKINNHRFCGVVRLMEGDEETTELLTSSPNYIIINYKVTEVD